jgi:A/G-specific adenine glycosylase
MPLPDAAWLAGFRRRVRAWYARHARDLPWRNRRDPYAIWVSEIMLQQTQVATVKPYFERFLAAFPGIEALAAADEDDVLRLWEGLGYYRRARQMHQAAKIIAGDHGGSFPRDPQSVRRLPGIGRYTAGAILSIAFNAREPILEANTTRLLGRLLAFRGDAGSAAGQRLLWAMAEAVLPRKNAGPFNQALMELGSEVCLPKTPRCGECPVFSLCRAFAEGVQLDTPAARPKQAFEPRHEAALIVRRRGRVLLRRCPDGGRWAGLWDLPRFQLDAEQPAAIAAELRQKLRRETGVVAEPGRLLKTLKHGVTRFRITLDCFEARWQSGPTGKPPSTELRWLRPAELADYPLNATGRKLAGLAGET